MMRVQLRSPGIAVLLVCLCLAAPAQSASGNPDLQRRYQSALMSYLYVEPWEVRHEVLVRVSALAAWMDLGLRGNQYIEAEEVALLLERVGTLMLDSNPLRIDGKAPAPVLESSSLLRSGPEGIEQLGSQERLELATATVGVIMSYSTDGMPQQVSVDWDLFSGQLQRVPVTATDPSGPRMTYVTPDAPVFTWSNFLRNYQLPSVQQVPVPDSFSKLQIPVGTVLCVLAMLPAGWLVYRRRRLGRSALGPGVIIVLLTSGAMFSWAYSPTFAVSRPVAMVAALDDEQATVLLQALLKNIYRACNLSREQAVYDKLALTASSELLVDIYLQQCRSFAVPEAGGSLARVTQLQVQAATARPLDGKPPAYELHGQWSALATLGRWGQRYSRNNAYAARLTVQAVDGYWKVTGLELLEERRMEDDGTPPAAGEWQAPQHKGTLL